MIELSFPMFFLLPLTLAVLALGVVWMFYTIRDIFTARARRTAIRLYRCMVCEHVYHDIRDVPLSRCPRCATLNEAIRR